MAVSGWGGGDIVGSLVGSNLGSNPSYREHRESWSIVAHREAKGGCIVEGRGWWVGPCCLASNGAWEDGLVHAAHVAIHGVGVSCRTLMVFNGACARCTGVVVVNVATMCMAVVPIFESFYQQGGGPVGGWLPVLRPPQPPLLPLPPLLWPPPTPL
jgi:hypothetical protein